MGELTEIEQVVIENVKKMRNERNMTQLELSQRIGRDDSFVSHVEQKSRRTKYNLIHLNEIAKVLACSLWDFIPKDPI